MTLRHMRTPLSVDTFMVPKGFIIFSAATVIGVGLLSFFALKQKRDVAPKMTLESREITAASSNMSVSKTYNAPPQMALEAGKNYKALIKTSLGDISVDLYEDKTPITVNNFVFLANEDFYNGVRFHRIIKDFMVQVGDPLTKDLGKKQMWGTGDPGYKFADEPFDGEYSPGILAMANSGPNTNGSQFFIMTGNTQLPKDYVIFGIVDNAAGMSVLMTIAGTPAGPNASGEMSSPLEDVLVNSIEVVME